MSDHETVKVLLLWQWDCPNCQEYVVVEYGKPLDMTCPWCKACYRAELSGIASASFASGAITPTDTITTRDIEQEGWK